MNEILQEKGKTSALKLPLIEVNLTQVSDSHTLAGVLASVFEEHNGVPIVFFDEFDAPRQGAPYGWLSWFLAPMQDGEFVHEGRVIPAKHAVYVFAGGTAATMRQFSNYANLPAFKSAKGPDFISRLRGFLDVKGPNADHRELRRAVIFRSALASRASTNGVDSWFKPDAELLKSLLQVGRYRYGARSIQAVVELSDLSKEKRRFGWDELPDDHLLGMHIDRGPLDSESIGGAIALSSYSAGLGQQRPIARCWRTVASTLWREGATLTYAGGWRSGSRGGLMRDLAQELQLRPLEPSANADRRQMPDPWLESFVDEDPNDRARAIVDECVSSETRDRCGLRVTFRAHLTDEERSRLDSWLCQVLERFRRRLASTESSVARFLVAGATAEHGGRFSGIAEEVMLTLAQDKPVYIAGGLGGAARDVGCLLGLSHPRMGRAPASLQADPRERERSLLTIEDELRPGPWADLPVTAAELASFLKAHALGSANWPDNGLTHVENHRLFVSEEPEKIARYVATGLLRRFGTP